VNTITASRAYSDLARHAEKIKNDDEHEIATMSVGDMWPQGDVGIVSLGKIPAGATVEPKPQLQLAPGTTQGSRHCLASLDGVTLYRLKDATPLDGPVIDAPQGCRVNHPEHGDVILPAGVYGIVYQRAFAEELRRVQD
jgi:hypothetical protein